MKNPLTPKESCVLKLLLKELSQVEISEKTGMKITTVSAIVTRIKRKWQVDSLVGIAIEATKQGYLEISVTDQTYLIQSTVSVLRVAMHYFNSKEQSLKQLLEEADCYKNHAFLDEFELYEGLRRFPKYADFWYQLSLKRPYNGWYLNKENSVYSVGIVSQKIKIPVFNYLDEKKALAVFIKREIERIRTEEK